MMMSAFEKVKAIKPYKSFLLCIITLYCYSVNSFTCCQIYSGGMLDQFDGFLIVSLILMLILARPPLEIIIIIQILDNLIIIRRGVELRNLTVVAAEYPRLGSPQERLGRDEAWWTCLLSIILRSVRCNIN